MPKVEDEILYRLNDGFPNIPPNSPLHTPIGRYCGSGDGEYSNNGLVIGNEQGYYISGLFNVRVLHKLVHSEAIEFVYGKNTFVFHTTGIHSDWASSFEGSYVVDTPEITEEAHGVQRSKVLVG